MNPTSEQAYVRTSVMVPADLMEELKKKADAGNRPVSYEIRAALEAYIEKGKA